MNLLQHAPPMFVEFCSIDLLFASVPVVRHVPSIFDYFCAFFLSYSFRLPYVQALESRLGLTLLSTRI